MRSVQLQTIRKNTTGTPRRITLHRWECPTFLLQEEAEEETRMAEAEATTHKGVVLVQVFHRPVQNRQEGARNQV